MAQVLIRGLDENVRQWLREQGARHGNSMEAEAREILTRARLSAQTDPIGQILARTSGMTAEPIEAPDQTAHDHADFR